MQSPQTRRPDCKYMKKAQSIFLPKLANDTHTEYFLQNQASRIFRKARKH